MDFKDTALLRHPTVEKAYHEMRSFFSDGDDFAKQAVKAGELISRYASSPDPDAIAASVLLNGMIVSYRPESFETSVSPQAAAYIQAMYALDEDNPVFKTEGERQIFLANAIVGLEETCQDMKKLGHSFSYRKMKEDLDRNETLILAADETMEQNLLGAALNRLQNARAALEDLVIEAKESSRFEKTGLPEHQTIRSAYELMRGSDDPLFKNRREMGVGIAKVLLETGASSDPDVIGAALLNQYWAKTPGEFAQKFSARLEELHCETSPWRALDERKEKSGEGNLISKASAVHALESAQKDYITRKKDPAFDTCAAVRFLELIEDDTERLKKFAQNEAPGKLKDRMEKSISAANALMYAPENKKVRKPGSPKID